MEQSPVHAGCRQKNKIKQITENEKTQKNNETTTEREKGEEKRQRQEIYIGWVCNICVFPHVCQNALVHVDGINPENC